MNDQRRYKLLFLFDMFLSGWIGILRKLAGWPSAMTVAVRGLLGAVTILIILGFCRKRFDRKSLNENLFNVVMGGISMGANWILLFEAYRYTTVAVGIMLSFIAPAVMAVLSPRLFGEKTGKKSLICLAAALVGMTFVSGLWSEKGSASPENTKGVILALCSAAAFCGIYYFNKKASSVPAMEKTCTELAIAGVLALILGLFRGEWSELSFEPKTIISLIILGTVCTGISHTIYFYCMDRLPVTSVAIINYAEPVLAIILSAVVLRERISAFELLGSALIIGAAVANEIDFSKKKNSACL